MHNKINIKLDTEINSLIFYIKRGNRINLKSLGYSESIDIIKNKINNINLREWNKFKKYSNEFEFPEISKRRHISRGYFKLHEILIDYNLNIDCESLHLCEAPAGFIEATLCYKQHYYNTDGIIKLCHTMSLIKTDDNIPSFHNSIVQNKNIKIHNGYDGSGNIYNIKNIVDLKKNVKNIKFITADGGINENGKYNIKENLHHRLIFAEILTTLLILENDGIFVLKIFDIFTKLTCDFIYLLKYMFNTVYINKPYTSRTTNSERYIVCIGYKKNLLTIELSNQLVKLHCIGIYNFNNIFFNNQDFISEVKKINKLVLNRQEDKINKILTTIKNSRNKQQLIVKNSEQWMKQYGKYL